MYLEDYLIKQMRRMQIRKSLQNGMICAYKNKRCSSRTCKYYYENEKKGYDQCEARARTAAEIGAILAACELSKKARGGQRLQGKKKRARLLAKLYAWEAARKIWNKGAEDI